MSKIDPENTIAFMGVAGANGDIACRKKYPYMQTLPCASFEDVFQSVKDGIALYGMIPIENSQAGRVAEIHQLLPKMDLHIIAEHFQPIEYNLLAVKGATIEGLKEAYSHPQALMQCRENLRKLNLSPVNASNTAVAAANIAKWNDPSKAAVSPPLAGELYGLVTLKEHIEDSNENFTVFVTIAREPNEISEKDRNITTLLFTARNIPAALYKALGGFATNAVNILKIESYIPGGHSNAAQFFLTFEGNPKERKVQLAIEELGFFSKKVSVLGVYPADNARYNS